jgi:small subunit ribosomal protein S16
VAVKIKLKRQGKTRQPYYRIVVADSRTARDGRAIEEIGLYRPKEDPSFMQVDPERVAYWLSVGAQPTAAVAAILKVTGDWQKFKGEAAPPPMLVREPKADKHALFEAAAKSAALEPKDGATTPKAKKAPKTTESADAAPETTAEATTAEDANPTKVVEADAPAEALADAVAPEGAAEPTPEA